MTALSHHLSNFIYRF